MSDGKRDGDLTCRRSGAPLRRLDVPDGADTRRHSATASNSQVQTMREWQAIFVAFADAIWGLDHEQGVLARPERGPPAAGTANEAQKVPCQPRFAY